MTHAAERSVSLYRRALGEDYGLLPAPLQRFHDLTAGGTATGALRVTYGSHHLCRLLARGMRLPAAGENIPLALRVEVAGETELWIRDFGGQRLVTRQVWKRALLIETAGALRFGFRLSATEAGMRFETVRCWLLAVPLPRVLAPRVTAEAVGTAAGWRIRVVTDAPLIGRLFCYEGEVIPSW